MIEEIQEFNNKNVFEEHRGSKESQLSTLKRKGYPFHEQYNIFNSNLTSQDENNLRTFQNN